MNGHFLLQTAVLHIPLVDLRLTEFDREFMRQVAIVPDIRADWRRQGTKEN
jgi:hypothetical protein